MMKDGITIKTDTIDMEAIRKEVELKQPIVNKTDSLCLSYL